MQGEQEYGAIHGHRQDLREGIQPSGIRHYGEKVVGRDANADNQEKSTDDGEWHEVLEAWRETESAREREEDDDVDAWVHLETGEELDHLGA